jgi:Methyltransferase domain
LGLEANESLVKSARQRQAKYFPSSKDSVKYAQHFIAEDSDEFIEKTVEIEFPGTCNMTLFGLHSCGDLSITGINLFFKMSRVKSLIIMPCCYHKLKFTDESGLKFTNFPRSRCLEDIIQGLEGYQRIFNRPFLRLACQETAARWRETDHTQHGRKMFDRALAEAIVGDDEQCVKAKVKPGNLAEGLSFANIQAQYGLVDRWTQAPLQWTTAHQENCEKLLKRYPNGDQLAECLTFFQTMLQEICEQVVLKDRLCFAEETAKQQGLQIDASIVQICNDKLSPRCYAFTLEKQTF